MLKSNYYWFDKNHQKLFLQYKYNKKKLQYFVNTFTNLSFTIVYLSRLSNQSTLTFWKSSTVSYRFFGDNPWTFGHMVYDECCSVKT